MTTVERARRAAAELLLCYQDAADTGEREDVARVIACLMRPQSCLSVAELAADALEGARADA